MPSLVTKEIADRKPALLDYVALWLVQLSKHRRQQLSDISTDYDAFYEKFFEEKDVELSDVDPRMATRRDTIARTLKENVPDGASLLDVGCGIGDALLAMPASLRLHAVDYAHSNVRIALKRLDGRADVRQASAYDLPFERESMDVALCLEVLEHIEDDKRAVQEIARVLRPGGLLIAAVPYTYYWPQYLKLMGHFRHYTRETFSSLLAGEGLKPIQYLPNYPHWHQTYTRWYAAVRAQSMTIGRPFARGELYQFRWPWRRMPALARVARRLEPLKQRDAGLDYSTLSTSTFILAQKAGDSSDRRNEPVPVVRNVACS